MKIWQFLFEFILDIANGALYRYNCHTTAKRSLAEERIASLKLILNNSNCSRHHLSMAIHESTIAMHDNKVTNLGGKQAGTIALLTVTTGIFAFLAQELGQSSKGMP
jgi:hypothetical protein